MSERDRHEWWQTGVIYEVYPRSFKDTTGTGVGDLQGVIDKLDYLRGTLGVDAIWVCPFYPSPMVDWGYDISDHCDVHPMFGDLATVDRLIAGARDAGIKVILDFVPNHTSDQHPWFIESRSSRESHRRNWYVWRDPKPDGSPPSNWLGVFGGVAWEFDLRTGQYYLHSFLPEQPDLNWRNPAAKAAMFDVVRFWLDRGVDGLRIDAALHVLKDPKERDNPPNTAGVRRVHKPLAAYDSQEHLYDQGHTDLHQLFRELRALLNEYEPPRMASAEIFVVDDEELGSYYGRDLDELHMPFNFGLLKAPWTAEGIRGVVDGIEHGIPDGAWPNYFLGNHDDQRVATRLGDQQSRQAAVLLLTLRGTPTLYYGDELGMRQAEIPSDKQLDPWGRNVPSLGRDGCRTPMRWSPEPGAGFTTAADAWLPIGSDHEVRNVESQLQDPDSHLNLYRRLMALRRRSPALNVGSYRPLDPVPEGCFIYERAQGEERVLIAINFSPTALSVDAAELGGRVAVSTHRSTEGTEVAGGITLQPHEAVVVV